MSTTETLAPALVFDEVVVRIGDEVVFEVDRRIPASTVVHLVGAEASTVSAVLGAVVDAVEGRTPVPDGRVEPTTGVVLDGTVRLDPAPTSPGGRPAPPLVALAPREHGLIGALTATENVVLGVLARRRPTDADTAAVDRTFDALAVPAAVRGNLAEQLSGGQQQRVAVARALVAGAPVIALDDPVSELDERTRSVVLDAIAGSARQAVVLVGLPDDGVTRPTPHERADPHAGAAPHEHDAPSDAAPVVLRVGVGTRRHGRHVAP